MNAPVLTSALLDPVPDAELREHGFTVVPLPAAVAAADELTAAYGELHGWSGQGFEPDLTNPDAAYRHRVTEVIGAALDQAATALFTGYQPFLRNFLCKWSGEGSELYLHRDWMYVDEREGQHTYVVWIPLRDVGLDDGPLQVLRGSHRIDHALRGTHLNAGWIGHDEVIRPRLETVTASLGQAVILDNATVHSSLPNASGQPRLVAAVGLRPTTAPLVHYCSLGGEDAARYDVDDEFFQTMTPQGLMTTPPDLPIAERLPAGQVHLDPDALTAALDAVGTPAPRPAAPTAEATPAAPAASARQPVTAAPTTTAVATARALELARLAGARAHEGLTQLQRWAQARRAPGR